MSSTQSLAARALPDRLVDHLRFVRARRAWTSAAVVFVHIPKNAGVSISRALYGRTLDHYRATDINDRAPGLLEQVYSFAVLRDPLARAVSAYRFARAGATADMAVAEPHRYRTPAFDDFDTFVQEWLVEQHLPDVDGIFRTQTSYVEVAGRVAVRDLFRLPDLHVLTSALRERGHRDLVIDHANASDRRIAVTISAESRELIRQVYREDYDLLAACQP